MNADGNRSIGGKWLTLFWGLALVWGMGYSFGAWAMSDGSSPLGKGAGVEPRSIMGAPLGSPAGEATGLLIQARKGKQGNRLEHGAPGHASLGSGSLLARRGRGEPEMRREHGRVGHASVTSGEYHAKKGREKPEKPEARG